METYLTVTEIVEGTTILSVNVFPNNETGLKQVSDQLSNLFDEDDTLEEVFRDGPKGEIRTYSTPDGEYSVHVRPSVN